MSSDRNDAKVPRSANVPDAEPILEICKLEKKFENSKALHDVSLSVNRGEVIAIIGPSGCGKSTLLRCVIGLDQPDRGTIAVEGEPLFSETTSGARPAGSANFRRIRGKMGMIFQSYSLFPNMTVLQNVMLAAVHVKGMQVSDAESAAKNALRKVGLADKINEYPARLSGGQKQRASIARAMVMEPKILLCDEITSALDPELIAEVLVVLKGLAAEGMTMLVVTHELGFASEVAHRVIFMDGGLIVEQGHPKAVLQAPRHERTAAFVQKVLHH